MSYKQVPITAKILKTTKGGVTQPLLNMGAPVQMKAPSPTQKRSRSGYKTPTPSAPRAKASNPRIKNSHQDIANTKITNANNAHLGSKPPFQAPLSGKLKPGEGVLKSPKQEAKLTKKQESFIKDPTGGVTKPPKTKSTKITGKIGSDLRRQQYKDRGWAMDDTTMKPKAKVANTTKAKGVVDKDVTTANIGREVGSTEALKSKPVEKKAPKLAAKRAPEKEVKLTRAQKARKSGEEALASGNTGKARRLRKKYDRLKAKEDKRAAQNS